VGKRRLIVLFLMAVALCLMLAAPVLATTTHDPDARTSEGSPAEETSPPAGVLAAGDVLKSWTAVGMSWGPWGVGFDGTVWVSDPYTQMIGKQYDVNGNALGPSWTIDAGGDWWGDMAYDSTRGWMYSVNVGGNNGIYAWNPATGTVTGSITGAFPWTATSQRGLAYRPDDDTLYVGGWNQDIVYHIKGLSWDVPGQVLDQFAFTNEISGLAWNPAHQVLWCATNSSTDTIYQLSPTGAVLGTLAHPGAGAYGGAGLEMDANGNLWMVDQNTDMVYLIDSGLPTSPMILRPNGDPSPLTLLGAAPHWSMLDDDPFNDATFVYSGSSSWAIECYPIEDPLAVVGEIQSVKVWIRGYRAGTIPGDPVSSARTYLQIGGTDSQGDMVTLLKSPPNATNYSTTYTTNPDTGLAWTWTDINNLRAGVSLRNPGTDGSGSSGCTEVWVEVNWVPNSPPVAVDDTSLDNFPGPVTLDVLANDTDPDGNLDVASVDLNLVTAGRQTTLTVAGEGTWTVDDLGNVTFTPEAGFFGDPTPITYRVSDTYGLTDDALITITYLRSLDLKLDAWDALDALCGTLSGSQKTYIGMARSSLTYALNPAYWLDDLHVKEAYGSNVFYYERQCLTYIRSAVTYYGLSPSEVEDIIEALVTADRLLACQAIADAIDASGSASKIATAQGYLAKADAYAAVSNWDYAVANYRNAWFYAVSAY